MAKRKTWEYQVGDALKPYAASGISRKDALIRWGIETDMKRYVCIWRRPIRTGAAQWELFKKGQEPSGEYLSPDRFDVETGGE
jgi:hypothetical protein